MKRMMSNQLAVIVMIVFAFTCGPVSAKSPPPKGGVLPKINLPVPENPAHRRYLGLSEKGMFQIPQIKTKVVIIEIFNMY